MVRAAPLTRAISASASHAQRLGDLVLVLEDQPIGAAGVALECDPRLEQHLDGRVETVVRHVDVGDGGQGPQRDQVAVAP